MISHMAYLVLITLLYPCISMYKVILSYAVHCVHMTHVMIGNVFMYTVLLCLVSLIACVVVC